MNMKKYLLTAIFGVSGIFFMFVGEGRAATITVNTLADENNTNGAACSLREAINNANGNNTTNGLGCVAGSGTDSIVFSVSGTISVNSALPSITSSMNIGSNTTAAPTVTVERALSVGYRFFTVSAGNTLVISGVTMAFGFADGAQGGFEGRRIGGRRGRRAPPSLTAPPPEGEGVCKERAT